MTEREANVALVKSYFATIQHGVDAEEIADFYAPNVVQTEFPNQFEPNGASRDLKGLQEAAERGSNAMSSQRFELLNLFADGSTVVVEVEWSGTLAVSIGDLTSGTVMRARFAQFFELQDGRITAQRNYDCFYPW